jgi:hypothetical protein
LLQLLSLASEMGWRLLCLDTNYGSTVTRLWWMMI